MVDVPNGTLAPSDADVRPPGVHRGADRVVARAHDLRLPTRSGRGRHDRADPRADPAAGRARRDRPGRRGRRLDGRDGGDRRRGSAPRCTARPTSCRRYGPVLGKGDAMWRSLAVLTGDVVCFLDADSEEFGEHYVLGLVGPLARGERTRFVKGFYRRPWRTTQAVEPEGGGRVTELLARPLLARFYPELAGCHQPLAGEIAARRDLLDTLPVRDGLRRRRRAAPRRLARGRDRRPRPGRPPGAPEPAQAAARAGPDGGRGARRRRRAAGARGPARRRPARAPSWSSDRPCVMLVTPF